MRRALLAMWSLFCVPTAQAEVGRFSGFIGGWAYDISGRYTNTSELDLQDDLALMTTARQSYALAYRPARLEWVPTLELDYIRIAADGEQRSRTCRARRWTPWLACSSRQKPSWRIAPA